MNEIQVNTIRRIADDTDNNPVSSGIELAIHEQRLPPGTRLAEPELCEIYGVSRTIVRAGLQSLGRSHLVELRPNRGARVSAPSPAEAREVFEARELLEPRTAREAARRATEHDVETLRQHCDAEHEALKSNNYGKALRLSGSFHTEVARIGAQQTLQEFIERLVARSALIIALYWRRESARCDNQCHTVLIDALAANDCNKAEDLMRSHLVDIHSALDFGPDEQTRRDLRDMLLK